MNAIGEWITGWSPDSLLLCDLPLMLTIKCFKAKWNVNVNLKLCDVLTNTTWNHIFFWIIVTPSTSCHDSDNVSINLPSPKCKIFRILPWKYISYEVQTFFFLGAAIFMLLYFKVKSDEGSTNFIWDKTIASSTVCYKRLPCLQRPALTEACNVLELGTLKTEHELYI